MATSNNKPPPSPAKTSYTTTRINRTTFLITEADRFGEHPFIYAKLHPTENVLILTDTGCNAPLDDEVSVSNLKEYLETVGVEANGGKAINPRRRKGSGEYGEGESERKYIVICTHCHYDHICGIESFAKCPSTRVVASGYDPEFITGDLVTHSLCRFQDPPIPLPKYEVTDWAADMGDLSIPAGVRSPSHPSNQDSKRPTSASSTASSSSILSQIYHTSLSRLKSARRNDKANSTPLDIQFLHTPGHTPDSLAWYDKQEMTLFTGDSFYERGEDDMPIIFPKEGDLYDFYLSMKKLYRFVESRNTEEALRLAVREGRLFVDGSGDGDASAKDRPGGGDTSGKFVWVPRRVKICAAHQTANADGEEILLAVLKLFNDLREGNVPMLYDSENRGEKIGYWRTDEMARFSILAPVRLVEEFRKKWEAKAVSQGERWT